MELDNDGCGGGGNATETLTTLVKDQANDTLVYTDENGTANTIPLNSFNPEICNGPFVDETGRSGWQSTFPTVYTANTGTITIMPYDRVGSGLIQTPDCVTDMKIDIDFGAIYYTMTRARLYSWIDYQILINGAVVLSRTVEQYFYRDERNDTNPDIIQPAQLIIDDLGYSTYARVNVPAGATVEVKSQYRINANAFQGGGSVRIVGVGLRSNASAVFVPRNIVTGSL